ncbi:MAG TPA: hypothetical protein VHP83_16840 [Aggregatilineaceae bacterium]|nr:hypothetical protein [Aggregatilineaceae bacterium]
MSNCFRHLKQIGCLAAVLVGLFGTSACVYAQDNGGFLMSVAWSPDGSKFATGHDNGIVKIWDLATLQELDDFPVFAVQDGTLLVWDIRWSPDGSKLAVAATSYRSYAAIQVLDVQTGQILAGFEAMSSASQVAWSPDGGMLAGTVNSGELFGYIKIWDTATWDEIASLDEPAVHVSWSPDGTRLASDQDGLVMIWDTTTWKMISYLPERATMMRWSTDGQLTADMGAAEGIVRIRDAETAQIISTLACEKPYVYGFAWQSQGKQIAVACIDRIQIWDVMSGVQVGEIVLGFPADYIDWHPQKNLILYGSEFTFEAKLANVGLLTSLSAVGE